MRQRCPERARTLLAFALLVGGCSTEPYAETTQSLCTVKSTNCNPGGGPPPPQYVSYVILTPGTSPDTVEEVAFETPNSAGKTATSTVTATPTSASVAPVSVSETNTSFSHTLLLNGLQPMTLYTITITVTVNGTNHLGYTGSFETSPTLNIKDVSATLSFPTLVSNAATVLISDPTAPTVTLASATDAPGSTHSIAFYELLIPAKTYRYEVWDADESFLYQGTFTTQAPLSPVGAPPGHCGASAGRTDDEMAGTTTCIYNVAALPAGAQCLFSGTQLGFSWTKTPANANYVCPSDSQAHLGGTTSSCVFTDDVGPQSYENAQLKCNVSNLQLGYTFTPHDPIIGPIMQSLMQQYGNNEGTAGWSVGVRRDGVEDFYVFGMANFATGAPVQKNTLFLPGSVTKTFTGALLGRFAADPSLATWHISLTDSVNSYLPAQYQVSPSDPKSTITLGNLARFQSGLERDPQQSLGSLAALWNEFDVSAEPAYVPGTNSSYSNLNFVLLGRAMELRLGSTWENVLVNYLLEPLGMSDTGVLQAEFPSNSYLMTNDQVARLALPYLCSANQNCTPLDGTVQSSFIGPPSGNSIANPAGSIVSSGLDMMTYLRFHMGHSLAANSWNSPQLLSTLRNNGLGWFDPPSPPGQPGPPPLLTVCQVSSQQNTAPCSPYFLKDGSIPTGSPTQAGYQASIGYQPSRDIGAFVMSNTIQNDPQGFVESILYALDQALPLN